MSAASVRTSGRRDNFAALSEGGRKKRRAWLLLYIIVFDFEIHDRADAGESVGKDPEQSAIAQADVSGCRMP